MVESKKTEVPFIAGVAMGAIDAIRILSDAQDSTEKCPSSGPVLEMLAHY